MKLLKIEFENIGIFEKGFTFDLTATDRVTESNQVAKIYKSIYSQNVVAVTGPNASGKTSLLKLLRLAFKIVIHNAGLDDISPINGVIKDGTIMKIDFYNDSIFYRLISTIGIQDQLQDNKYYFKDEIVYSKVKSEVRNKESVNEFEKILLKRSDVTNNKNNFLKPQDSIVSIYTRNDVIYRDTISTTNINIYHNRGNDIMPFVNLFDNSIEFIKSNNEECEIKFKNKDKKYTTNIFETENYLSSGTIKGSNLFFTIALVMKTGGYLIIDEIENHIQKKLVQILIGLFTDEEINRFGSTLIFSTHYSEIIDVIDRKDNIYVLVRDQDFVSKVIKYSELVNRNDIKKSEILLSNYIDGTSPSYELIKDVKELLCKLVNS